MSVQEYFVELHKGMIRCGIKEDPEDKVYRFYGGLRREIQDIVYYKDFNTTNQLFQLAMLAEKEIQGHQQKNQANIGDNFNQVLARVEQAFTKIETMISRRVVVSTATAASSPPPPTPTLEHEGEQYWLLPTICPPTKLKPRTVCCQEGEDNENIKPSDTAIDYKVPSFLYLHSNFGYNSLDSTCTCHYLNICTNVSQSASLSKLNFWFVGSPTMLHWEGHNSSIRSAIEVNEHLMESLFDRSGPTSISYWQGLQIIKTFCHYFCQVLLRRCGLVIHT
jgi:hypothetical protein